MNVIKILLNLMLSNTWISVYLASKKKRKRKKGIVVKPMVSEDFNNKII